MTLCCDCRHIPEGGDLIRTVYSDGCTTSENCDEGIEDCYIDTLEHVEVYVKLETGARGDIELNLISPMGTTSEVLSLRKGDTKETEIDFTFMTVHNWGEKPEGEWTLLIRHRPRVRHAIQGGTLYNWSLTLYGTNNSKNVDPIEKSSKVQPEVPHVAGKDEIDSIMAEEEESSETVQIDHNEVETVRKLEEMLVKMQRGDHRDLTADTFMVLWRLLVEDNNDAVRDKKEMLRGMTDNRGRSHDTDYRGTYLKNNWLRDYTGKKVDEGRSGGGGAEEKSRDWTSRLWDNREEALIDRGLIDTTRAWLSSRAQAISERKATEAHERKNTHSGLTEKELDGILSDFEELRRALRQP